MKVLLINDFEYEGGAEKVFRDTRDLLQGQFDIYCFVGSEYHQVKKNPFEYIYSSSEKKRLQDTLKSVIPDIIHIHVFAHLLTPSVFNAIKSYKKRINQTVKVIYTAHDFHLICPNSGYLSFEGGRSTPLPLTPPSLLNMLTLRLDNRSTLHSWLKKLQWAVGNKFVKIEEIIDLIITPSHFLKSVIKNKFFDKEIKVVRNPVDFKAIEESKQGMTNGMKIVYFGRLSEEKGIYEFLSKLPSLKLDFSLDIIGDGPEKEKIQSIIQKEGLKGRVQLLDKMDHAILMKELAIKYHAMVLPSLWYENAPLSLVEASKSGLAILGSNWGGLKEISDLCGNNFLFDPSSEADIHHQLQLCYNYIQSGFMKNYALNEFGSTYYSEKISVIYREISNPN
ncbi:MAG: glycosyltransferase involved in cell wall biosynthesis [Cyclobacteriaceae bacterium]|jgi:glycosyltransferase involved in cell wall biosynthesis